MLHVNHQSLLALLLTSTLLLVQTALPWLHVGCRHDHSAAHAQAARHQGCQHAQHQHGPASTTDSRLAFDHRHAHLADDCAACRFSLLSSLPVEVPAGLSSEQVSLLPAQLATRVASRQPAGLYRSRAPPAIS